MEAFLSGFKAVLEEITEDTFESNIKSLIARKLEKHRHLSQETGFYFCSLPLVSEGKMD